MTQNIHKRFSDFNPIQTEVFGCRYGEALDLYNMACDVLVSEGENPRIVVSIDAAPEDLAWFQVGRLDNAIGVSICKLAGKGDIAGDSSYLPPFADIQDSGQENVRRRPRLMVTVPRGTPITASVSYAGQMSIKSTGSVKVDAFGTSQVDVLACRVEARNHGRAQVLARACAGPK